MKTDATQVPPWSQNAQGDHKLLVLLAIGFSACKPRSGGSRGTPGQTKGSHQQGLWVVRDEAEELRSTGKLISLCAAFSQDPEAMVMNIRLVDGNGSLYVHDPHAIGLESLKVGVVSGTGELVLTASAKEQIGNGVAVAVSVERDEMTFTFKFRTAKSTQVFLRSSEDEIKRYYAALEACKK